MEPVLSETVVRLLWGLGLFYAADLVWVVLVNKAPLNAKTLALHSVAWGFLVLVVAAGGILLPVVLLLFGALLPLALLVSPTDVVERRGRLHLLQATITLVFMVAAVCAPLRAAATAVGLYWGAFPADFFLERLLPLGPRAIAWFDLAVAACGGLLAGIGGPWSIGRLWRQARQVENLPTSKARSAAAGLAEFKGIAREATPPRVEVEDSDPSFWRLSLGDTILFNGEARDDGRAATRRKWSAFHLEDETGRILVDPRGAEFWDGQGGLFFESIRKIHLPPRIASESNPFIVSAELRAGDPVYLLGSVEVNPDAAPDAADSDRLVVRPRPKPRGFLERVLLFEDALPGAETEHVFFLSSKTEAEVAEVFRRGLRQTVFMVFVWLVASSWLFAARLPVATAPSASFLSAGIAARLAERDRQRLSRALEQVKTGETPPAGGMAVVLEALARDEPHFKARAVSTLLSLLGKTDERPPQAIPLLVEFVESGGGGGGGFRARETALAEASLCLSTYGAAARPAVPALIGLLAHSDNLVRFHAVAALEAIGAVDERVVPALARALTDVSPGVRVAAAEALWRLAWKAKPAVQGAAPALTEALGDADATVRKLARRALDRLGVEKSKQ